MFQFWLSKYPFLLRLVLLFVPLFMLFSSGTLYFLFESVDVSLKEIELTEKNVLQQGAYTLNHHVSMTVTDLQFLARQDGLVEMVSGQALDGHDHVSKDWLVFSKTKSIYDQIRWLDANGMERKRVNYNSAFPISVAKDKLQNKGQRYYFTDAVKLNRDEIFISPLDLNMENGEIEKPLKPVIRIGTPVFDIEGNKQGIILLNIFADSLIRSYTEAMGDTGQRSWLLNSDGYWLKGPSSELEWGFMYHNKEASMQNLYLDAWKQMKNLESGYFFTDNGLWTFTTIYPLVEGQKSSTGFSEAFQASRSDIETHQFSWKAVLFLPKESYQSIIWLKVARILFALTVVLVVILIGCWLLARLWVKRLKVEEQILEISRGLEEEVRIRTKELNNAREIAEHQARTDELTGMNNRRAFFEYGMQIQKLSDRYHHNFSIIMLDLDRFKNINDTYGHATGDKVLKVVAKVIYKLVRGTDIAARIGGEEFAIILPEAELNESFLFAERIRQSIELSAIEVDDHKPLSITVSIGLAESTDKAFSIEKLLGMADNALYHAKKSGRNQVVKYSSNMVK